MQAQQAAAGAGAGAGASSAEAAAPGEKSAQDDIVDADFKEVKDK
jgi:molecular chaperone DnaK